MNRYLLNLMYDGSEFHGWQIQPKVRTVQAEIERILARINQKPVRIYGAGRTDAKVHATDQYAHFDSEQKLTPAIYKKAINSMLPADIKIKSVFRVKTDFHARYQVNERWYHYLIDRAQNPFLRHYAAFCKNRNPSISFLENAAMFFIGTHDFSSFSKYNPEIKSPICNIQAIRIFTYKNCIVIRVSANRFLHHMVRRMVGTMLMLEQRNLSPAKIKTILEEKNPCQSDVFTAPAEGLYLVKVKYPPNFE